MQVLPVVIFFSSAISVLYHLGVMQFFIKHIGRLLTLVMDTSPVENVVAIANIFVGQVWRERRRDSLFSPFAEDTCIINPWVLNKE